GGHRPLAERPEARADLCGKQLRLLPGGEVTASVGLVEVNEVGVDLFHPIARGLEDLAGEQRERDRERDLRWRLSGCRGGAAPSQYIRAAGVAVFVSQYSVMLSTIASRVRWPEGCPPAKAREIFS